MVVFPPIFLVDTKLIYGYNFVAPLIKVWVYLQFNNFHIKAPFLCKLDKNWQRRI